VALARVEPRMEFRRHGFRPQHATSSGRLALTPRTHAVSGRSASESKWTTCIEACTPVSVRPAAIVPTRASAIFASARSSASCTPRPSGCDCQPVKLQPQYSSPNAKRMVRSYQEAGFRRQWPARVRWEGLCGAS
jgi:hypothetical protein